MKPTRSRRKFASKKESLHQINEQIESSIVRLVSKDGEQLGPKPVAEARELAQQDGLDLVLVAPDGDPPVARIMDYGKFKYEMKKRQHQAHRHQSQLKELRLRAKTEEHDLQVRLGHARRFLSRGDRVMVNMLFRGRELAHKDRGRQLLEHFAEELADTAKVEKPPTMEHNRMHMILVQK